MRDKNLIGKKYRASDNSWQINLSDPLLKYGNVTCINNPSIAGTSNTAPVECTILTNRFKCNVTFKPVWKDGEMREKDMIIVRIDATGEAVMTLFHPDNVIQPDSVEYIQIS